MDVSYPAEVESFRAEMRAVLAEELPPGWAGIGAIAPREDAERFAAQAAAREAAYEQAQTALRTAHLTLEEEQRSAAVLESQELQLAADVHAKQAAAEKRAEARAKGYEGEACGECGNFTLVRNGTCLKCDTCGSTTGCS